MKQYIDKATLVAEIERLDALYHTSKDLSGDLFIQGLFCLLDTSEVKETDLGRLVNDYFTGWYFDRELDILAKPNHYSATVSDVKEVAKHFFELGMRCSQTDDSYIEGVKGSYTTTDKD